MKTLLNRVFNILFHPGSEWRVIKDEPATYSEVLVRYVAVIAAIPSAAAVCGRVVFDGNNAAPSPMTAVLMSNAMWYATSIVNVMITGAVISAVIATAGSRWNGLRGLRIASCAFTPLFAAGVLAVIPSLAWSLYPAILYGIYILYLGIKDDSSTERAKAAWHAGTSFVATAVIVGVLDMFEYVFESFVTTRLIL